MSFGRNPHVAKAEAAELKAESARDATASALAWREAARQWDRASEKEADDKKRTLYTERADAARARAEGGSAAPDDGEAETPAKPTLLN